MSCPFSLVASFPLPSSKDMQALRTVWAPPVVQRAVQALCVASSKTFEEGVHYRLVRREAGRERPDLPVWTPVKPNLVPFDDAAAGPILRTEVAGVPGAFVLSNVLADSECAALTQVIRKAKVRVGRWKRTGT